VCMYIRLYLENGYIDLHQNWHAYYLKSGRDFKKFKTPENLPGFEHRCGWFLYREGKHDRRTTPRPELFGLTRILQEQRPKPRKTVLASSPDEESFCNSEIKHDRRTAPKPKLFVSATRLQQLRSQTRKLSWVGALVKMLGLGILFCIFNG
jgi:hypothetical protein